MRCSTGIGTILADDPVALPIAAVSRAAKRLLRVVLDFEAAPFSAKSRIVKTSDDDLLYSPLSREFTESA